MAIQKDGTSPMAMQPGRYEKRSAAAVAVMLTSPDPPFPTEMTTTENISSRGARVVTKGLWRTDESLVIKSLEGDLYSEARVIYRQPMREGVYAIGLELIEPAGRWRENEVAAWVDLEWNQPSEPLHGFPISSFYPHLFLTVGAPSWFVQDTFRT